MLIYLYVKTHNITGLKYFGKTIRKDPHKYKGSGKRWKNHIKKHGYNVTTDIIGEYTDIEQCKIHALKFSIDNNIVESNEWANLKNEVLDGGFDHINKLPIEIRRKRSIDWWNSLTMEEQQILNIKKVNFGKKNGMFGVHRYGRDAPMYNKHLSDKSKKLISTANKNKMVVKDKHTNEIIGLIDKQHENILNGIWISVNKNRKASLETKKKLSLSAKKRNAIPPSSKNKLWWNNGVINKRSETCPGEGFIRGRLV